MTSISQGRSTTKSSTFRIKWWELLLLGLLFLAVADVAIGKNKTLAIVDDDQIWLDGVVDLLSNILVPGVDIDVFVNCELLLAAMDSGIRYKFYVSDTDLGPGRMDGFACVSAIKAKHPGAVVYAASAEMSPERRQRYTNLGVDGILQKPGSYLEWLFNFPPG